MAIAKTSDRRRRRAGLAAILAAAAGVVAPGAAMADMDLAPLRQVLDSDHPRAEFAVSNPSDRIVEGRVSWIDLAAAETGYESADPALRAELSAAPYLVVSPAHFRLKPGGRQTITVEIKKGAKPPKGERRSHLLIETEASRTALRKASNTGLQVDVGLGMSAPVILRNGGKADAKITDVKLLRDDEGLLMLETTIEPKGDWSSYGRMVVTYKPKDGEKQLLGIRDNVAGFTDAEQRKVTVPFGFVSLGAGELTVRYEGAAEYEGVVFDSRAFDIKPPEDN
ncbi:hypothetical protein [Hyphococcus luteus]|uniref:Pili assembly chaperone N-terminal domain-containing protein n=1 Tax=Hyphococcus luteus TaxID=2058213 RepID=A0A2S7KAA6_9PROT|nr:hypothetical protein [Marinicaulis flavus]PQA89450.1 hypothetical protein CW354_00835 [Marinicaulis flavus]